MRLPRAASSVDGALRLADRVERSCSGELGETLAGLILHGSLTLGDYLPGRSDIDLLAVVEDSLTDAQLSALVEALTEEARQAAARVDFRVVTRQVASAPTPVPPMKAYIALQPGLHVEADHPGERELLVELSICRAHGRSLAGLEPSELIGEVPPEWVLDVGDAQLADWQGLEYSPEHGELMVLTACRVWRFSDEQLHCSKSAAGEWALRREPTLRAVRAALHRRRVDPAFPIEEEAVRELLALVRTHIAELRGS